MESQSVLTSFAEGVAGRVSGDEDLMGFDIVFIIAIVEMVATLIENCKASRLEAFVNGQRSFGQIQELRSRCAGVVRAQGVQGPFRVARAARRLADAVIAEMSQRAGLYADGQNPCEQAIKEATELSS